MILLLILASALCCVPAHAEEGIRGIKEGLSPRAAERVDALIDERMRWVHGLTQYLRLGYSLPTRRPNIFVVSRQYILSHEAQVCPNMPVEDTHFCALHVFGWTDDDRNIYVLRAEDVARSEGFPTMSDFPADLWVEMTWTHELVHYEQLEGSPYRPSTLPCDIQEKWENEAFLIGAQWLHSLQSVDAERINSIFRGQLPHFRCGAG